MGAYCRTRHCLLAQTGGDQAGIQFRSCYQRVAKLHATFLFFTIWPPKPPKPDYIRFGSPSIPVECGHEPKKYPAIQKSATICHPHGAQSITSRDLQYEEGFKSARSQNGTHPRPNRIQDCPYQDHPPPNQSNNEFSVVLLGSICHPW